MRLKVIQATYQRLEQVGQTGIKDVLGRKSRPRIRIWAKGFSLARELAYPRLPI